MTQPLPHLHHHRCAEVLSQLNEYADDALTPELCVELEAHLAECENCQVVLDTLRKTIYLVRRLNDEPQTLPEGVEQRLFAVLDLDDYLAETRG